MLTTGQRALARARSGNGTHERAVPRPLQCRRMNVQECMVIWAALWRKHVYHERDCTDMAEARPSNFPDPVSPPPIQLAPSPNTHSRGHVGAPNACLYVNLRALPFLCGLGWWLERFSLVSSPTRQARQTRTALLRILLFIRPLHPPAHREATSIDTIGQFVQGGI